MQQFLIKITHQKKVVVVPRSLKDLSHALDLFLPHVPRIVTIEIGQIMYRQGVRRDVVNTELHTHAARLYGYVCNMWGQ